MVKDRCANDGLQVLGLRFTSDRFVPAERFEFLREQLGDAFVAVELDDDAANPDAAMDPHSVLTEHLIDEPGNRPAPRSTRCSTSSAPACSRRPDLLEPGTRDRRPDPDRRSTQGSAVRDAPVDRLPTGLHQGGVGPGEGLRTEEAVVGRER